MRVGIAGSTGFIGGAVADAVRSNRSEVVPLRAPRIRLDTEETPRGFVEAWPERESLSWDRLVAGLVDLDVVVNAAGLAAPASSDAEALDGANGVLPALLARAAVSARVRRLVHVSSAAVQGALDPLDESLVHQPFSPYSRSKALGEELLLEKVSGIPLEVVVHRPTSVQGEFRSITQRLVRLAGRPFAPLCGDGDAPLPITLVENVAAAIAFLVTAAPRPPTMTLQPWEGMTTRSLLEAFGDDPRFVSLPPAAWRAAAKAVSWGSPAVGRRIELLGFGQRQEATALPSVGFELPLSGPDAYRQLAERTRARVKRSRP